MGAIKGVYGWEFIRKLKEITIIGRSEAAVEGKR